MASLGVQIALILIKIWISIYQVVSYPFYFFFKDKRYCNHPTYAMPIRNGDPSSPWRNVKSMSTLSISPFPGCRTLLDLWMRAARLYPNRELLGTRETLSSDMELQPNGKKFIKCKRGEYYWETYSEIQERIDSISIGFVKELNLVPGKDRFLLFAETRAEWMITIQAAFRSNLVVTTLYATLGEEAIVHGITESESSVIFTSEDLLAKLVNVLPKCPAVKHVVFMNDKIFYDKPTNNARSIQEKFQSKLPSSIKLSSLTELEQIDYSVEEKQDVFDNQINKNIPTSHSLAFIMYTSGSTGVPKGVEITHGNVVACIAGFYAAIPECNFEEESYISYLPLAHVMELTCELMMVSLGVRLGYSSPQTLTDNATKIARGTKGDVTKFKPTVMVCVPTILDRISKTILEKVARQGELYAELFKWQCEFKQNRLNRGYPSPFLDHFVFQRIRNILGGRLKFMISGGAPLSGEAHKFLTTCFCPIQQGYGLTETCAGGAVMDMNDLRTGVAGTPVTCAQIKLRSWDEGGYHPTDLPLPRGEILISGAHVTRGYFKQPEKTAEAYFTDEKGVRWFCTGDIGTFKEDGTLMIIDRKKDLVKLQGGEYVSLGKVELAIAQYPLVDNVCVYANSSEDFTLCLISVKKRQLKELTQKLDIVTEQGDLPHEYNLEKLCENKKIIETVTKDIQELCSSKKIERFEVPKKVHLDTLIWSSENGLLTDAMKLKRREIQNHYQSVINKMYGK